MPTIQKTIRIFNFIKGYIASNHEAPTFREIANRFGFRSFGSVSNHLQKMQDMGWIKRTPNISRGIEIVEQERKAA